MFHFGFDPDTDELDKADSLFSLIVSKEDAKLVKHKDRRPEKRDPEVELDSKSLRIKTDKWYSVLLERKGTKTIAQIQEEGGRKIIVLEADHESFKVNSPMMVFRCLGNGFEFDDVKVWEGQ